MAELGQTSRWRDHAAAALAALAVAQTIGLVQLADWLPRAAIAMPGLAGLLLGAGLCGIAYALVIAALYRRRLIAGPLYRCGETRPDEDYGKDYRPAGPRLLDSWHYH